MTDPIQLKEKYSCLTLAFVPPSLFRCTGRNSSCRRGHLQTPENLWSKVPHHLPKIQFSDMMGEKAATEQLSSLRQPGCNTNCPQLAFALLLSEELPEGSKMLLFSTRRKASALRGLVSTYSLKSTCLILHGFVPCSATKLQK